MQNVEREDILYNFAHSCAVDLFLGYALDGRASGINLYCGAF